MASNDKFNIWLINLLQNNPLEYKDIMREWEKSSLNDYKTLIPNSTFRRYLKNISDSFLVEIVNDRSDNKYRINTRYPFDNKELLAWLTSSLQFRHIAERLDSRDKVMLDAAPPNTKYIDIIMDAINKKRALTVSYKSHYSDTPFSSVTFMPAFIRFFKQRWYVIGERRDTQETRTFALERISEIAILEDTKLVFSRQNRSILSSPQEYFKNCYGVIRQHEPIKIRFRAFWPQNLYLEDVRIHASQIDVVKTENYTDFTIEARPTYDLKQEFMFLRDKVAVLEPESFRQDMIELMKATIKGYETGEYWGIDE